MMPNGNVGIINIIYKKTKRRISQWQRGFYFDQVLWWNEKKIYTIQTTIPLTPKS
jgi:hypothetical protein